MLWQPRQPRGVVALPRCSREGRRGLLSQLAASRSCQVEGDILNLGRVQLLWVGGCVRACLRVCVSACLCVFVCMVATVRGWGSGGCPRARLFIDINTQIIGVVSFF